MWGTPPPKSLRTTGRPLRDRLRCTRSVPARRRNRLLCAPAAQHPLSAAQHPLTAAERPQSHNAPHTPDHPKPCEAEHTARPARPAQPSAPPCATACTQLTPGSKAGMSHWPWLFAPQATTWPSVRNSTVWYRPPATWAYRVPGGNGGASHWPQSFSPHAVTPPSVRKSTSRVCGRARPRAPRGDRKQRSRFPPAARFAHGSLWLWCMTDPIAWGAGGLEQVRHAR